MPLALSPLPRLKSSLRDILNWLHLNLKSLLYCLTPILSELSHDVTIGNGNLAKSLKFGTSSLSPSASTACCDIQNMENLCLDLPQSYR